MGEQIKEAEAVVEPARAANAHLRPLDPRPLRHVHHGQTAAMWTAVIIELVGFLVGATSLFLGPNWIVFGIAVLICLVGIVVGIVMQKLGLGIYQKQRQQQ